MNTKYFFFTALLTLTFFSCTGPGQSKQDKEEEELRNKMKELKNDLNDMQKDLDKEMKELKSMQDSLEK